ncbi:MAG TPA: DUF5611 family protein [Thermoplasmata archaeon]|nr:DUF5611 family protein [Thermoplasmata archaeon]
MQSYELKRGLGKRIEGGNLKALVASIFGAAEESGGKILAQYGALEKLATWTDGKSLFVDTLMDPRVGDDVARSTIAKYNRFLEQATGYTAKERSKRAQEKAKTKT